MLSSNRTNDSISTDDWTLPRIAIDENAELIQQSIVSDDARNASVQRLEAWNDSNFTPSIGIPFSQL